MAGTNLQEDQETDGGNATSYDDITTSTKINTQVVCEDVSTPTKHKILENKCQKIKRSCYRSNRRAHPKRLAY